MHSNKKNCQTRTPFPKPAYLFPHLKIDLLDCIFTLHHRVLWGETDQTQAVRVDQYQLWPNTGLVIGGGGFALLGAVGLEVSLVEAWEVTDIKVQIFLDRRNVPILYGGHFLGQIGC